MALVGCMDVVLGGIFSNEFAPTWTRPVYYVPSGLPFEEGVTSNDWRIRILNPCKNFFRSITSDLKIDEILFEDCERSFSKNVIQSFSKCINKTRNFEGESRSLGLVRPKRY